MSKFTFGPVPSRRLGKSFGIDLVPFKTCSHDCIYCQLGCTSNKTVERKEYVPITDVLREIESCLKEIDADYITLSGSGEPTLNSGMGDLICGIKKLTSIPVAVLTNGSLLPEEEVRDALSKADLVVPSLDASSEKTFQRINRPHPSLRFDRIVEGIAQFRRKFSGKLWLEIMFVDGINTSDAGVRNFIPLIERINPDRVQLNTVVRPPAEEGVHQVSRDAMERIRKILGPKAELIVEYDKEYEGMPPSGEEILATLKRRPCSLTDLVSCTGLHRNEILKYLTAFKEKGVITATLRNGETYYQVTGR
jgi:wyosine [tRNA(Phe)-imidazoG37] synthetase (radical SAM superfamily)